MRELSPEILGSYSQNPAGSPDTQPKPCEYSIRLDIWNLKTLVFEVYPVSQSVFFFPAFNHRIRKKSRGNTCEASL